MAAFFGNPAKSTTERAGAFMLTSLVARAVSGLWSSWRGASFLRVTTPGEVGGLVFVSPAA